MKTLAPLPRNEDSTKGNYHFLPAAWLPDAVYIADASEIADL